MTPPAEMTASRGPWSGTRLHVWFYQIVSTWMKLVICLSLVKLKRLVVDSRPSTRRSTSS